MIFGDTAFFETCETCKKKRVYSAKRNIQIKNIGDVKSQKRMCKRCYNAIINFTQKSV